MYFLQLAFDEIVRRLAKKHVAAMQLGASSGEKL
jgi:hypothetical protein